MYVHLVDKLGKTVRKLKLSGELPPTITISWKEYVTHGGQTVALDTQRVFLLDRGFRAPLRPKDKVYREIGVPPIADVADEPYPDVRAG